MAISTYKTFLMKGTGTGTITYAKLVDIKEFPDLGGVPESIDVTTLSDGARHYIPGIQGQDSMTFTANYSATDYATLKGLEGVVQHLAVWFGATVSNGVATPTGSEGKFEFDGYVAVNVNGGGVNEAVDMTITVFPTTDVVKASS